MTSSSSEDIMHTEGHKETEPISISLFPGKGQFQTSEQIHSFELLRLACFALKLRKFEQQHSEQEMTADRECALRGNLLRHAIFQQVLTLTRLHARDQALQLIEICRN